MLGWVRELKMRRTEAPNGEVVLISGKWHTHPSPWGFSLSWPGGGRTEQRRWGWVGSRKRKPCRKRKEGGLGVVCWAESAGVKRKPPPVNWVPGCPPPALPTSVGPTRLVEGLLRAPQFGHWEWSWSVPQVQPWRGLPTCTDSWGWIVSPPEFISTRNLRMWPCLAITSLQM